MGADTDDGIGTGALELVGTAHVSDVLAGKTFYNNNAKSIQTGTMQTMGGQTVIPSLSQQVVSTNGRLMTGDVIVSPIPNQRGQYQYAAGWSGGNDNGTEYYAMNGAPEGYYVSNGQTWAPELRLPASTVRNALGIYADRIVSGQSIAGIAGTAQGYRYITGTTTSSSTTMTFYDAWGGNNVWAYYIEIPNIGFTPSILAGKAEIAVSSGYVDCYYYCNGTCVWVFAGTAGYKGITTGAMASSSLIRVPAYRANTTYSYSIAGYV